MIDRHIISILYEVRKHCKNHKRTYKHCHGCIYSLLDKEDNSVYCALYGPDFWELKELAKKGVV